MDSSMLKYMISNRPGGMKAFSQEAGIPNTTLYDSLSSDERLGRMPIENFKKVANALGMTIDQLVKVLEQ